jgi:hypothetical protein
MQTYIVIWLWKLYAYTGWWMEQIAWSRQVSFDGGERLRLVLSRDVPAIFWCCAIFTEYGVKIWLLTEQAWWVIWMTHDEHLKDTRTILLIQPETRFKYTISQYQTKVSMNNFVFKGNFCPRWAADARQEVISVAYANSCAAEKGPRVPRPQTQIRTEKSQGVSDPSYTLKEF